MIIQPIMRVKNRVENVDRISPKTVDQSYLFKIASCTTNVHKLILHTTLLIAPITSQVLEQISAVKQTDG